MENTRQRTLPRWIFALLSIGGLLACGIYLGIMSVEGWTGPDMARSIGYGLLGLVMFWGAIRSS